MYEGISCMRFSANPSIGCEIFSCILPSEKQLADVQDFLRKICSNSFLIDLYYVKAPKIQGSPLIALIERITRDFFHIHNKLTLILLRKGSKSEFGDPFSLPISHIPVCNLNLGIEAPTSLPFQGSRLTLPADHCFLYYMSFYFNDPLRRNSYLEQSSAVGTRC